MIENLDVMEFLKRIAFEFCGGWTLDEETQKQYLRELSAYKITAGQWNNVFETLSRSFSGNGLPPLAVIRAAIHEVQAPDRYRNASRKGKLVFRRGDHEFELIIQLETSVNGDYWAIASVKAKRNGETVELQRCPGVDAFAYLRTIPDAEFIGLYPDDRNLCWNYEIPPEILETQRKPIADICQLAAPES